MSKLLGMRRHIRWVASLLTVSVGLFALAGGSAQAQVTLTPLTSEAFTGATTADPGWFRPSAAGNAACLTAGANTSQLPIKGCVSPATDAVGDGALRLTGNGGNLVGTVFNTTSLPTAQGLHVKFNTYQWNGLTNPGADGISFILAATDPANPAPPAATGPNGGSLGYSATKPSTPGVSYGYLGFGLDVYGNFQSSNFGGTDCPASPAVEQSITVRGPGHGMNGYCKLGTAVATGGLDSRTATTRPSAVPVEVVMNPGPATTTASGLAVGAMSWLLQVTTMNGTVQTLTGALPTSTTLSGYNFPASYFDPVTGLPYQLTFGWAASTGGSNEIHEINMLQSSTLNGQLPTPTLAMTDNQSGKLLAGNRAVVTVTPSLSATEGAESRPVTVTTTFPTGLTPGTVTGSDYVCTISGQTASCTYTPAEPVAPGAALPALHLPVTIASGLTAGSYSIASKISSTDAKPAQTSHTVAVGTLAATATPASVVYGTGDTLAMTGLPGNATGSVVFTTGATELCTATLPTTSCVSPTDVAAGSHAVTATYSGDGAYGPQAATTSYTVTKATASFTAAASPATVAYGTPDTLSVTGIPAGATGTVTFASGGTALCTATLPATSCATGAGLAPGSYPVTATYAGDGNVTGSSATATFAVTKSATSFTAAASASSVQHGTADTLSVTGIPAGATGTVTFASGGTTLCTATLPVTSCATGAGLAPGSYPVTATYPGDAHYTGSTATTSFAVTKADTSLTAGATSPSVVYGSTDTLTHSGLPAGATGTVTFTSGGTTLCAATLPTTSCTTSAVLAAGTYPVTATYSGDANHRGTDGTTTFTVTKRGSSALAAAATPASTSYGVADTLSFTGLPADATGTVTFVSGGRALCAATLPVTSCGAPADLDTGTYAVTATYSGDDNHDGSTATARFTVVQAETALNAGRGSASVTYGGAQTLSYDGLPAGATGTVTFASGGKTLCTVTLPETSCGTPADLGTGTYPVTAAYSGDANHEGSGDTTGFTVTKRASTGFAAAATPASTVYGTPATLSFTGLPAGATGTVEFVSAGATLCTVTLPATSCATPAGLGTGTYPVTATYPGDGNHEQATDATGFTVTKAASPFDAGVGAETAPEGTRIVLTATGLPAGATGTVAFSAGGKVLCTATLPATGCATKATLPPGTYRVRAAYSGDADHTASSATTQFVLTAVEEDTVTTSSPPGATTSTAIPGAETARSVEITGDPAHGTATIVAGRVVYTPVDGFVGTDTVTVRVVDADGTVRVITIKVHVAGPGAQARSFLPTTGRAVILPALVGVTMLLVGSAVARGARRQRA
ncbi:MAG: hypothetical protein QOC93_392 [Actinomycetota bacterium]|jgi:hypothetical protein|nr:hypothetical protein [Actinomycetota bacterium]